MNPQPDFDARLRSHILMMAPHQKDRQGGKLLIEAQAEIARLKEWNQSRAGEFACIEQRLATRIAVLETLIHRLAQRVESHPHLDARDRAVLSDLAKYKASGMAADAGPVPPK